ncbi:hypothetical protein EZV73_05540 [Acidaminobacter sp. JC074]|uniref:DUF5666 domain-containing protein n=1 Tax=Acidaminobacter sp. JC074 TaxID=2530199 RepID=UPI001F110907|nr:DUF5666 domain-containing protein [Acidaminobacter sp. JC074]MCH4887020.1 hypothetical protein [Acidaminobacter sp. JC074]
MKKIIVLLMVALMAMSVFIGCAGNNETSVEEVPTQESQVRAKVLVNISGVIAEVDGEKVTLEDGTFIIINEDTVFADDPDNGVEAVNSEIQVGNFIQGYTADESSDPVIASRIYINEPAPKPSAKVAVNISGKIVEIDGNKVKLDNGMWVVITEETIFEDDPDNGVEAVNSELKVGNYIVGFTLDDSSDTVTAYQIYSNGTLDF